MSGRGGYHRQLESDACVCRVTWDNRRRQGLLGSAAAPEPIPPSGAGCGGGRRPSGMRLLSVLGLSTRPSVLLRLRSVPPSSHALSAQRGRVNQRARSSDPVSDADPVPLRLTVTRGSLGMELYEPVRLGPLTVDELSLSLPGLRFPVDLSGGVPRFRHRRGDLEHVRLVASTDELGGWLQSRVGALLGAPPRPLSVWARRAALGVGMVGERAALAFDLVWAPHEGDARFVVANARGVGLRGPALGVALRTVDSTVGQLGQRHGRVVHFAQAGLSIARWVLPSVGARSPATDRVRLGDLLAEGDRLSVELDSGFLPPAIDDDAARALELAELVSVPDDALATGDLDSARQGYLTALEQAPRHPEIVSLVAEIDLLSGDRAEAALGMIVESMQAVRAGWVGAELLARVGDLEAAREAVAEAARGERYAPLAALLWARMAALEPGPRRQLEALDRAVACSPSLPAVRWTRFEARVEKGRIEAALADAEHLEAAASGSRERHRACCRAARHMLEAGFVRDAGRMFERALRYLPDDADATAGLARALLEAGRAERAFSLLERAIELGGRQGRAVPEALMDLARLLAERLGDLPQAIARVRQVPGTASEGLEARALEGRYRSKLGDLVGASLAFSRLREGVELASEPGAASAQWLLEAGRFERDVRQDLASAERHLAVALRVSPRNRVIADEYREVAAVLADALRSPAASHRADVGAVPATGDRHPSAETVAEAERLQGAVQADPGNLELVLRLVDALERLGREHELLALLSARLEEGSEDERAALAPHARAVLGRLLDRSRREDRHEEAELYAAALARLTSD